MIARWTSAGLLAVHICAIPGRGLAASGETEDACVFAYEATQTERRDGRWILAMAEAQACLAACPETLQADCHVWAAELEKDTPTVIAQVRDLEGRPFPEVTIRDLSTGALLPNDGRPAFLDAGAHELEARTSTGAIRRPITLTKGQKQVEVLFVFPRTTHAAHPEAEKDRESLEVVAFPSVIEALGLGLGAAALALLIAGHAQAGHLRGTCAPECQNSDRALVEGMFWAAGGLGAAGLATFGIGYGGRF